MTPGGSSASSFAPTRCDVLEHLDYVYMPSRDVAADATWFVTVLGARLAFAVEGMGARVAMVELTAEAPRVLLADHLEGDQPILIYRVADLDLALKEFEARGWTRSRTLEIPPGPCCSFTAPGGQRIAIYERTRAGADEFFENRRDF